MYRSYNKPPGASTDSILGGFFILWSHILTKEEDKKNLFSSLSCRTPPHGKGGERKLARTVVGAVRRRRRRRVVLLSIHGFALRASPAVKHGVSPPGTVGERTTSQRGVNAIRAWADRIGMRMNTIRLLADKLIIASNAIRVWADAIRMWTDSLIVFSNAIRILTTCFIAFPLPR